MSRSEKFYPILYNFIHFYLIFARKITSCSILVHVIVGNYPSTNILDKSSNSIFSKTELHMRSIYPIISFYYFPKESPYLLIPFGRTRYMSFYGSWFVCLKIVHYFTEELSDLTSLNFFFRLHEDHRKRT